MKSSSNTNRGGGGQLLQELEALSQALYKAQSFPSAPPLPPPPRREFDQVGHRRRASEAVGRPKQAPSSALESRHSISEIIPTKTSVIQEQVALDVDEPTWNEQDQSQEQEGSIDLSQKKKPGGFWNWKPVRALAHIGQQRFHCEFSAHVHGIEKLPPSMNGLRLQVQLRHRETGVQTMPARVQHNGAEFEEILHFRCTVYGSKKSSGGFKYMSKSFTLSVVAIDVEELDLGKHQLDLSKILPSNSAPGVSQDSSSSWNTSFKLSGKAKGSSVWITFSYELLDNKASSASHSGRFGQSPAIRSGGAASRSFSSLPSSPNVTGGGGGRFTTNKSSSVMDFGSPAMSEPGHDYGEFQMDQFSLDDEPPVTKPAPPAFKSPLGFPPPPFKASNNLKSIEAVEHRGKPMFGETVDPSLAPRTPGRGQEIEREEDEDVGLGEFSIVEKGTESSPLGENEYLGRDGEPAADRQEEDVDEREEEVKEREEEQEDGVQEEEEEEDLEEERRPSTYEQVEEYGGGRLADEQLKQDGDDEEEELIEEELKVDEYMQPEVEQPDDNLPVVDEPLRSYDWRQELEEDQDNVPVVDERSYNWRQELEEDYLFDSLRNPGLVSSNPPVAAGKYWEEESEEEEQEHQVDPDDDGLEAAKELMKADDEAELVADEFLDMLEEPPATNQAEKLTDEYSVEEPDSPRALLLRQFEQEAMLDGGFGLDLDEEEEEAGLAFGSPTVPNFNLDEDEEVSTDGKVSQERERMQPDMQQLQGSQDWSSDEDKELAAIMDAAESELQKATQAMRSKARAKMLEDAEAEALLQEWGLNEQVFHDEPPGTASEDPPPSTNSNAIVVRHGLPPLAPGLAASVPTADGGSLRSMDPSHFDKAKNDGKLVMHVSKPVVVPSEMGSSAIEVLRNLAAAGTESMAAEAMAAMPLDDITGKSVQQIALEGQVSYEENSRRYDAALLASNYALEDGSTSSGELVLSAATTSSAAALFQQSKPRKRRKGDEVLQLDELAPVAMEKIEELAMQGLKIQCDMGEEDAPYALESAQNVPLLTGSSSNLLTGEGTSDGMISMSLSLDEWMRLDAGLDDEEAATDKTKAVMAAHRAAHTTTDLVLNLTGEKPDQTGGGKMGDTLTLAMLVQLRDPLRNYEPVGAPMMALVEAERVMIPPRPKLWKRVAIKGNSEAEYNDEEEQNEDESAQPQFKITGVHMAGLNVQDEVNKDGKKKQVWGNQRQQQSGSRWLVANGMGKTGGSKHPLLKSAKGGKGRDSSASSLWSISARPLETPSSKPVVRNPDVKFGKTASLRKTIKGDQKVIFI